MTDGRIHFDESRWREVATAETEIYERVLVPGIFAPWVDTMVGLAGVAPGHAVLDVGCGTGVLARKAAAVVGPSGSVAGLDLTPAMIAVAGAIEPAVDWHVGDATDLPFDDDVFDVVLCQAALMFFPDRVRAVSEIRRVLRPGGRVAVMVWAESPGQEAFARMLGTHVSRGAADRYRAPWVMTDPDELRRTMVDGGFTGATVETRPGFTRYPTLEEFLTSATILLAGEADPADLAGPARAALSEWITPEGGIDIPTPANVAVGDKE